MTPLAWWLNLAQPGTAWHSLAQPGPAWASLGQAGAAFFRQAAGGGGRALPSGSSRQEVSRPPIFHPNFQAGVGNHNENIFWVGGCTRTEAAVT